MFKKSHFPVIFNIFLAFFITLTCTIFMKVASGTFTVDGFIISMIQGFCLNMTLETLIDLPAFGNLFVRLFRLNMEGLAAYFVQILFIVILIVLLMSGILMFCDIGFAMGLGFFGFWLSKVPGVFVVAYITALIVFIPCMKATGALCSKE